MIGGNSTFIERRNRERLDQFLVIRIMRWRFLVVLLVFLGGLIAAINDTGQPNFDLEFDDIVLIFVFPIVVWLMLSTVAIIIERRFNNEEFLQRYKRFSQQLTRCRDWDALVRFVTDLPATLVPGAQSTLFFYHPQQDRFEIAGPKSGVAGPALEMPIAACSGCPLSRFTRTAELGDVATCKSGPGAQTINRLCVALSYEDSIVGRLYVVNQSQRPFNPALTRFLEVAAPEMALALALSRANAERLRQVTAAAQRTERQQIAYALHDSIAQEVGFLHMSLDRLATEAALPADRFRADLQHMRAVAGDVYLQVRDTLVMLRAQDADQLSSGIRHLIGNISAAGQLHIELHIEGEEPPMVADLVQQTLSFVRECLHNAAKHARARQVHIGLRYGPTDYQLTVSDDGHGFDTADSPQAGHYGLSMLAEKIRALDGQFVVTSTPGQGTQVTITLPLRPALAAVPG